MHQGLPLIANPLRIEAGTPLENGWQGGSFSNAGFARNPTKASTPARKLARETENGSQFSCFLWQTFTSKVLKRPRALSSKRIFFSGFCNADPVIRPAPAILLKFVGGCLAIPSRTEEDIRHRGMSSRFIITQRTLYHDLYNTWNHA